MNRFNFEELLGSKNFRELQRIFYKFTGIVISFVDTKYRYFTFYPKSKRNSFCRLIQSTKRGLSTCIRSDTLAGKKALEKGRPYIYHCPHGLIDIIVPIKVDNIHMGNILSGQLLTERPDKKRFNKIKDRFKYTGIGITHLQNAFLNVQYIPKYRLNMAVKFLSFIANYVIEAEARMLLENKIKGRRKEKPFFYKMEYATPFKDPVRKGIKTGRRTADFHINDVKTFIEEHFNENITLKDMAEIALLSPAYFSQLFKDKMKVSPIKYLTMARINASKKFLKKSFSVKEASYSVGYTDPNYFCAVFKKYTGTAPTRYQRRFSE
ncbi:MAG: PocR ligand-binding domain-containing protein [Candidatus Omnitrophica bacterium]|nr:PocR ligand-binding domain-containing protein [Candidatus Omnitrophota bacterium]